MRHTFGSAFSIGWREFTLLAAALVAGCSVAGSSALKIGEPSACTSDLGAYYLPKHHVTIALRRKKINDAGAWTDKDGKPAYELVKFAGTAPNPPILSTDNENGRLINVEVQPDPQFGFCLDYIAVPTTKDRLIVARDSKTGLLQKVATKGTTKATFYEAETVGDTGSPGETDNVKSENQSEVIAGRIIQTTFTGLARRPVRSCDDEKAVSGDPQLQAYCLCVYGAPTTQKKYACAASLGYTGSSRIPVNDTAPFQSTHRGEFADPPEQEKTKMLAAEAVRPIEDRIDIAFNVDFDPTEPLETARMNGTLTTYGYCAFLGDGKVDLKKVSGYCKDPLGYAQLSGFRPRATRTGSGPGSLPFRPYSGGVLYRARVSYPFYIFKREGQGWQLLEQEQVELANRGPIVSVGIDRAFFATRNTVLDFKDGTLSKIDIDRGSELKAFAGIPLALVTSIVKLPGQVLLVKIDQTTDTAQLIEINKAIISAQLEYNRALGALNRAQAAPVTDAALDPDRRSKLLNACESVLTTRGGPVDTCRDIVDQSFNR